MKKRPTDGGQPKSVDPLFHNGLCGIFLTLRDPADHDPPETGPAQRLLTRFNISMNSILSQQISATYTTH